MSACTQCGTCCRKGGPLLHQEDAEYGVHYPPHTLVTLRQGELAYDPVVDSLVPLGADAIKLAGTGETTHPWHCLFHNAVKGCALYTYRPAQCRALSCTDTTALRHLYTNPRLTRQDFLRHVPQSWLGVSIPHTVILDVIEAHEEQCPLLPLVPLAMQAAHENHATQLLLDAVRYDLAFREVAVERGGIPPQALPFVLGRPLSAFLLAFGLGVVMQGDALHVQRVGKCHYPG